MEFFDTHAHFEPSLEYVREVLSRAREAGVTRVLAVGGSDELAAGASLAVEVAAENLDKYPIVGRSVGWDRDQLDKSPESLSFEGAVALGEIGLDYHYSPETRKAQMDLFARQLEIACSRDLPVIIHTREADDDTLGILREIPSHGVIHSFTGNPTFCRQLLDLGFSISMSGIVTFRAAENVRESARLIPLDRLL
ncbi:MAG: TatD family hydrolase, partial [Kiritimatiellae bacterium]|nr:TatD family hydrolase [Kiritimatiellia bacterium]